MKVFGDRNAVYALIQIMAAAAHLVTPSQRDRIARWNPSLSGIRAGNGRYFDLYVVLHEMPAKGLRLELRAAARNLAGEVLRHWGVSAFIREIHVIDTKDAAPLPKSADATN